MSDSAAVLPVAAPYRDNRVLRVLVWLYLAVFLVAAIAPVDRETWLLENLLVFAAAGVLVATHRYFAFSNLSNGLLFAFFVLHAIGAHYTYSAVPLGAWVQDALDLRRNHYDRVVHLAFGLLLAYPVRELVLRAAHVHRIWSYLVPAIGILGFSAGYEIIESWAARFANPELGLAYVGSQGDVWDGQKDMTLALLGACIALGLTALYRRSTGREPYLTTRPSAPRS